MQAPKLIILGRDGILNVFRDDHVKDPAEWTPVPGALEAVAQLNQEGWHVVIATNQSGIGRGMIDIASFNAVHARMMELLAAQGGRIDAVFFCPHAPEDGCDCRKPLPGLMLRVAERYGVRLADVPMVGDTARDLQAAVAAGCEPHLVLTGRAAGLSEADLQTLLHDAPGTKVHPTLGAFAEFIIQRQLERGAHLHSGSQFAELAPPPGGRKA
jgi:D-glycero-D-manno-heptose 1,7-bisphosphate phosphatase